MHESTRCSFLWIILTISRPRFSFLLPPTSWKLKQIRSGKGLVFASAAVTDCTCSTKIICLISDWWRNFGWLKRGGMRTWWMCRMCVPLVITFRWWKAVMFFNIDCTNPDSSEILAWARKNVCLNMIELAVVWIYRPCQIHHLWEQKVFGCIRSTFCRLVMQAVTSKFIHALTPSCIASISCFNGLFSFDESMISSENIPPRFAESMTSFIGSVMCVCRWNFWKDYPGH